MEDKEEGIFWKMILTVWTVMRIKASTMWVGQEYELFFRPDCSIVCSTIVLFKATVSLQQTVSQSTELS